MKEKLHKYASGLSLLQLIIKKQFGIHAALNNGVVFDMNKLRSTFNTQNY